MVIEDEATVQGVLKFHLERAGLRVSAFFTVEQAIDTLEPVSYTHLTLTTICSV